MLAPYAARIGPDPASIDAAMIGGIVSNNSSGMCAGVVQNSYHTLESLEVMLADGTVVDTARADADERLRRERPPSTRAFSPCATPCARTLPLAARIRKKFETKNTVGYSLQAFLDHDSPAQILAHLMVGAQGTLGFLASVTLRTLPEPPEPRHRPPLLPRPARGGGGGQAARRRRARPPSRSWTRTACAPSSAISATRSR